MCKLYFYNYIIIIYLKEISIETNSKEELVLFLKSEKQCKQFLVYQEWTIYKSSKLNMETFTRYAHRVWLSLSS